MLKHDADLLSHVHDYAKVGKELEIRYTGRDATVVLQRRKRKGDKFVHTNSFSLQ